METEHSSSEIFTNAPLKDLSFASKTQVSRAKTSLRLRYEAEARVALDRLGGLEAVRSQLGLSQRQISQLLLVDPSAWTRWTRRGDPVPPHVVRALEWYLALEKKEPAWAEWREQFLKRESALKSLEEWRRQVERRVEKGGQSQISTQAVDDLKAEVAHLREMNHQLKQTLDERATTGLGWKLVSLLNVSLLLWWLFKSLF